VRGFCLGFSLAMAVTSGAVHASQRIIPAHPERKNMPEARKRDLVLDDLKSILAGAISPTSIATKPYASTTEGLCRRDVVQLNYYRMTGENVRNGQVKPIGVSVTTQFHFLGYRGEKSWAGWQDACGRLSGEQIYWAFGDGDSYASFALARLTQTVSDVRQNQRFTIDCADLIVKRQDCVTEFLSASSHVTKILRCLDIRSQDNQCYRFYAGEYEITISTPYRRSDSTPYTTAIKMESQSIILP